MQTRSWDAADGKKQYRTEIVADRVQFGPRPSGAGPSTPFGTPASVGGVGGSAQSAPKESVQTIEYPSEEINPEDIPF